ncbi:GTPase [Eubacteriales bacterium KG127]
MKNDKKIIIDRLQNVQNYYSKLEEILDDLPFFIPSSTKTLLKKHLGEDEELERLMDSINSHRPPRILIVGKPGSGKTTLISALSGSSVDDMIFSNLKLSQDMTIYNSISGKEIAIEVLETTGFSDNDSEDIRTKKVNQGVNFYADIGILTIDSGDRKNIDTEISYLAAVNENLAHSLPVLVVLTKADGQSNNLYHDLMDGTKEKLDLALSITTDKNNIRDAINYYKKVILSHGSLIGDVVPFSALSSYNLNTLRSSIEKMINDSDARMGFKMTFKLDEVLSNISKRLVNLFSGMAAVIALSPIPIADLYVLITLQSLMVAMIARLSGRNINVKTGLEFIISLGGVAGAGIIFRGIAQQISKIANVLPFAGSAISSAIAMTGTKAIGNAAITHFISDVPMKKTRKIFKQLIRKENKRIKNPMTKSL